MRQLRLVGLAEEGDSLLLESPTGESYRLPLDERVRAACRGDLTRLGQIEIESDNPLRPREIQARVRAGESAEQVAASAGMALDRVLRFAYPVLQERSRVVAQARTAPVRPPAPEQLGDLVEERLVGRGTGADTLEWDAWRREDGRWAVRLSWRHGDSTHAANWSLDLGRRALQSEDPAAEQLSAKEFHARTITAVTPLAVAARAAAEPTSATRPAGSGRPDPGRTARSDRDRAPGAVSGRPDPGRLPAVTATAARRRFRFGPNPGRTARSDRDRTPGAGSDRAAERDRPPGAVPDRTAERDRTPGAVPDRTAERDRAPGAVPDRTAERDRAARPTAGTDPARTERSGARRGSAERPAGRTTARGERGNREGRRSPEARNADAEDDGEPSEGRIAAGGGTIPLVDVESDDDRARRATVPSWDDILLGVRRRH